MDTVLASTAPIGRVTWPRTVTDALGLRRYVVSGERAYLVGTADGRFPQLGWHIRGEMGGVWFPPNKVLDGYWLTLDGQPLPPARAFRALPAHAELVYPTVGDVQVTRTEFALERLPAILVGITLRSAGPEGRSICLGMGMRSKLMGPYPWSDSQPRDAATVRGRDVAALHDGTLRFHDPATRRRALVRASIAPQAVSIAPQDGAMGTDPPALPGGAWGSLSWVLVLPSGAPVTLWLAVAGSDLSDGDDEAALSHALADPRQRLSERTAARHGLLAQSRIGGLPPDLGDAFDAAKLNLADLRRAVPAARLHGVDADDVADSPRDTIEIRGLGAGFPDYPHFFGGDGCYATYGLLASGQWDVAKDHLRLLRDASRAVNGRTGKVVHEVTFDGTVTYGTIRDAGNADETPLLATASELIWRWSGDVGFRDEMYGFVREGMRYLVDELDPDNDGYPSGEGGTERIGAGDETLAVCVTTWEALRALQRLASDCADNRTASWAADRASRLEATFDGDWWMADAGLYADSLGERNRRILQRHWIGVMPMTAGLAPAAHAAVALGRLESAMFSGPSGLGHTGGDEGSADGTDRRVWTIANAMMAVAEANYGRLDQALRYMRPIAAAVDLEMPGALPEVLPSPGYEVFGDFRDRLMFMQAWSAYGVQWPVVHHFLGIRPDVPGGVLSVVPHLPPAWRRLSVEGLRVGDSAVSVTARRGRGGYCTDVDAPGTWRLFLGVGISANDAVRSVRVDGVVVPFESSESHEGRSVGSWVREGGHHRLVVTLA